jgi:TonB family protein
MVLPAPISAYVTVTVTYIWNAAWQAPLIYAAAWLSARCLERMGPRAVHKVWVGALLLAVALPACRLTDWSLPFAQLWQAANPNSGSVQVTILQGTTGAGSALRCAPWLMHLFFAAFVLSVLLSALRLGRAVRCLQRSRGTAAIVEPTGDLRASWDMLRARIGGYPVRLAESASGPMVVGVRHPLLLVPFGFFRRMAREDRDAALAHELAHVQRKDFAKNLAYIVLAMPVAWHPCAWLLRSRIAESREMICDAMAAEALSGRKAYARSLLRLAAAVPLALGGSPQPAMGIFDGNTLERRVTTMMDKRKTLQGAARWAAVGAVALLTVGAGASTMAMHMDVMAAGNGAGVAKVLSVKGSVMEGNILSRPAPVYPPEAKAKHEQGTCVLGATINKEGKISKLSVVKSAGKDLDKSALAAVSQWRYKPYLLNGEPVEVQTTIHVTYSLAK